MSTYCVSILYIYTLKKHVYKEKWSERNRKDHLQRGKPIFLETHLTAVGIFQVISKMHACLTDTGIAQFGCSSTAIIIMAL